MYYQPANLLPLRSRDPAGNAYLQEIFTVYVLCRENEHYDFAYLAAYNIFISWVFSKLWFLGKSDEKLFRDIFSLHRFENSYSIQNAIDAKSPTELRGLKLEERKLPKIFERITPLIKSDESAVFKSLVDLRNDIAHPSGIIQFTDEVALDEKLEILDDLARRISNSFARKYISGFFEQTGNRLTKSKIIRWEAELDIETGLVAQWQLAQTDMNALAIQLHLNKK